MEIEEDNLFIDIDTLFMNSENIEKCDNFQIGAQQGIEAQIKKAFTFQIISEYMTFSDHAGSVLLKFQRRKNEIHEKITGNWQIIKLEGRSFNQIIEIN